MPILIAVLSTNIAAAALILCFVLWFAIERAWVRRAVAEFRVKTPDSRQTALAIAGAIHRRVQRGDDDPHFLVAALAPIGATPSAVFQRGGCCSGISRLCILALDAIGVEASQIALYHVSGVAQHCLVEISVNGVDQVIDPTYGLAFERADGAPASLADLQAGVGPRFAPLPGCSTAAYPANPYYAFDYPNTKTANWTKSALRRFTYAGLSRFPLLEIDRFRLPILLEWPQIILACAIAATMLGIDVVFAAL
jgi:hypothetical protein